MEILEIIQAKRSTAMRYLRDLLDNYGRLDDSDRMDKANMALDNISSYLQIQQNLLFPFIEKTGEHDDIMARSCEVQNRIDEVLEKAVMVHVDEPGNVFYHDMNVLFHLLEQAEQIDRDAIFPWARVYLTKQDDMTLLNQLRVETAHESQPKLR